MSGRIPFRAHATRVIGFVRHEGKLADIGVVEDAELMRLVQRGSTTAFAELYDRFSARALRVTRSICPDHGQAEDAAQEAFLSIWNSRATYRSDRGTVAAWLLAIVRNRAIDFHRRTATHTSRRAGEQLLDDQAGPADVAGDADARAEREHLRSILARLPDAQREAITLAFYGQLTHQEIATHLDLPAGTIKGRIRLGLDKLHGQMQAAACPPHSTCTTIGAGPRSTSRAQARANERPPRASG